MKVNKAENIQKTAMSETGSLQYGFGARKVTAGERGRLQYMAQTGVLAAMSAVLMLFSIPLPFAPAFYKLDLSEVPVLIGCFALGPMAAVAIEAVKILINLCLGGTQTAGVGELANFLIGCSFCIPAGFTYIRKRSKGGALAGMVIGTVCMAIAGGLLNAYLLLPVYAKAFHMPIEQLVAIGTAVNPRIQSLTGFILLAVVPFNIVKGILVSAIVFIVYKKISKILVNRRFV